MRLKMSMTDSATDLEVIDYRAMASGQCVAIQAAVSINLAPPFPLGRGPTINQEQSAQRDETELVFLPSLFSSVPPYYS